MGNEYKLKTVFIHPQEDKGMTRRVIDLPPDSLMIISSEENPDRVAESVILKERPQRLEGREDSANGVWFADAKLQPLTTESPLSTQPIAIKPLIPRLAAHEARLANAVNSEGGVATFQPFGFANIGGKTALVSKFEEGVVSFDNVLWADKPSENEVEWALGCAAKIAIGLHSQQIVHGDFQVKNTAYDAALQPRIIDLTTSRKMTSAKDNPHILLEDLSFYCDSLTSFGLRESRASNDQIVAHFLDPYYQAAAEIFTKEKSKEVREAIGALALFLDENIL